MIVICEECGKKYRVNPDRMKGNEATFKCRGCQHSILVTKPFTDQSDEAPAQPPPQTNQAALGQTIQFPAQKSEAEASPPPKPARAKKKGRRTSLVAKVVSLMLIVSLVPLATFWLISFKKTSDRIRQDTEALTGQITEGLATHVDEWIDKNVRSLTALAQMEGIQSMDPQKQTPLLEAVAKAYPWVYLVFTTDTKGINQARSDGKPLKDYSDRQYYKDVMAGKDLTWQTLIGKTSKRPAIVLAIPIKRDGQIVGVLANAMRTDVISKRIATWRRGNTGFAFLVDETGKVVAHQIKAYVTEERNLSKHPLVAAQQNGREGAFYFQDNKGADQIGNVRSTRYGWAMAIQQSSAEAFDILRQERQFAYMMAGITVFCVLLIAWLAGRGIVSPIKKLTDAADRISVGELDVEVTIKSKDEIAALGEAISRMQDSIRLSIERLRRRKRAG